MILGIGVDICEISRIKSIFKKYPRFFERIITPQEEQAALIDIHKDAGSKENEDDFLSARRIAFLAKRWAAKEAFAKASSFGLAKMGLQRISVIYNANRPVFSLDSSLHSELRNFFNSDFLVHLSISDEKNYAIAYVVIESI